MNTQTQITAQPVTIVNQFGDVRYQWTAKVPNRGERKVYLSKGDGESQARALAVSGWHVARNYADLLTVEQDFEEAFETGTIDQRVPPMGAAS